MSAKIFNNILREYAETISRVNKMSQPFMDDYEFKAWSPHYPDLVGKGDTEKEANDDLEAQIEEMREAHSLP